MHHRKTYPTTADLFRLTICSIWLVAFLAGSGLVPTSFWETDAELTTLVEIENELETEDEETFDDYDPLADTATASLLPGQTARPSDPPGRISSRYPTIPYPPPERG